MITLLQLKYFQALANRQHLGQTAKDLFVSQPTLSTMIAKLEKELGVSLFDRKGNHLQLNANGAKYLQYVNSALIALSEGENAINAMKKNDIDGFMTLAISGANSWGHALIAFRKQFPRYIINQQSEAMPGMQNNLLSETLDMAIAGVGDLPESELDYIVLNEGRINAVFPHGHHLENREEIRLADLDGEPLIFTMGELPYTIFCRKMFHEAGISPRITMECDYTLRPRFLKSGIGIVLNYAPSMNSAAVQNNYAGFKRAVITDDCAQRKLALFWKKGRQFTPIMAEFTNFLIAQKD